MASLPRTTTDLARTKTSDDESPSRRELSEENRALRRRVERLRQDRNAAFAVALVGAILAVFGFRELLREPRVLAEAPAAALSPAPRPLAAAAVATFVPDRPAADVRQAVEDAVRSWADAWSRQDVDAYLRCYSSSFRDSEGLPRRLWEERRRARLEAPAFVRVTVEDLETSMTSAGSAVARFAQIYYSPDHRDRVSKTLEMRREGDAWKITRELSAPRPAADF